MKTNRKLALIMSVSSVSVFMFANCTSDSGTSQKSSVLPPATPTKAAADANSNSSGNYSTIGNNTAGNTIDFPKNSIIPPNGGSSIEPDMKVVIPVDKTSPDVNKAPCKDDEIQDGKDCKSKVQLQCEASSATNIWNATTKVCDTSTSPSSGNPTPIVTLPPVVVTEVWDVTTHKIQGIDLLGKYEPKFFCAWKADTEGLTSQYNFGGYGVVASLTTNKGYDCVSGGTDFIKSNFGRLQVKSLNACVQYCPFKGAKSAKQTQFSATKYDNMFYLYNCTSDEPWQTENGIKCIDSFNLDFTFLNEISYMYNNVKTYTTWQNGGAQGGQFILSGNVNDKTKSLEIKVVN